MRNSTRKKKTILFLAANPKNSSPLDLTGEVKGIEAGLQRSQKRDKFVLEQVWAVTPGDVQRAMLDYRPQIVHFSGHGAGESGLILENAAGQAQFVKSAALAGLFELFADKLECVVLNACYSEVQAMAIAHHIPYVVGMSQAVGDRSARVFAVGFYDALGAGESFDFAYKLGRNRIALEGIAEDLIPVMTRKVEVVSSPLSEPSESASAAPEPLSEPVLVDSSQSAVVAVVAADPADPIDHVELEEPEGQVPLESALYIERPPVETRCYEALVKPGALIRIKAPRQMGKSSLMLRILNHGIEQGYQAASLNFQLVDRDSLSNLDQFLQWFCNSIANELNLEDKLADYWKGTFSSKNKSTNYFQRYLLPELQRPVVLCLDEVDQVFEHPPIATDFFGMLRAWHEDAKIKPIWKNLRLVIVHSKEVYIPLNINQSPFNVGVPIELPLLTQVQVVDLVRRHGLNWKAAEVERLMSMVGGHPFLVRVALYEIARGEISLEHLLQIAPTEGGLYGEHLRRHLLTLEEEAELLAAMKQIVTVDQPISMSTSEAFKLTSLGLVQFRGSEVVPTCNLYRQYFRERLRVGA